MEGFWCGWWCVGGGGILFIYVDLCLWGSDGGGGGGRVGGVVLSGGEG